jgi:GTPase Era involved in 16S rRNA processing
MNERTFAELERIMLSSGDEIHVRKLRQLNNKFNAKQLNIAFCGHFSAGKSSLINALCGHPLLPSSPIPTSANIVSIRNGKAEVRVTHSPNTTSNANRIEKISLEQLAEYCKDGEYIESIAIDYPIPFLGDFTQLLDTPGIDSTDDAHYMATESALHLADAVFYVMDYNHVQSETNLAFTKRMKDWGKPVYLIINQIDKHKPEQLSFAQFRTSVEECFRNWQVEPNGILYTTLKQPQHNENEWYKLQWLINELILQSDVLRKWSLQRSLEQIIVDHSNKVIASHETEKEQYRQVIFEQADVSELMAAREDLNERLELMQQYSAQLFKQWNKEMTATIENANLIPASTRDLIHEYLNGRKPGFKLGFFSRAAQTQKEIENRLLAFHDDFTEKVNAHLSWHLIDYFKKVMEQQKLASSDLLAKVNEISSDISAAWLAEQVNTDAVFSNEYTMNFAKQISADVKAMFRKQCLGVMDLLLVAVQQQSSLESERLTVEISQLDQKLSVFKSLEKLENEEQVYLTMMKELLVSNSGEIVLTLPILPLYVAAPKDAMNETVHTSKSTALDGLMETIERIDGIADQNHAIRMKQTAKRLYSAAELIEDLSSMKLLAKSMREKAKRLDNNRFTISLFGAFSAGKSSFANALIGEKILPVSPNPTTATINRIVPPTTEWPHGSVRVKMKSKPFMLEELQYSADRVGIAATNEEETFQGINKLTAEQLSPSGKPHFSFLKAAALGWAEAEPSLGNEIQIDLNGFASYVADETKSCFVERIDLHYNHPLTSQGIVFVDTPGADSIHARHTGVAFNYIKNADAIVFVTYYNHAFSQADREFLLQLGRVKDSFEMDKMFFIVNAADLAKDEEELGQVIAHVESNLLKHGIRKPRIYPVSSMEAVEGKILGNPIQIQHSGMARFEKDFIGFTLDELTTVAVHSAEQEIARSVDVMEQRIVGAQQGAEQRKQKLEALEQSYTQMLKILDQQRDAFTEKEVSQEIQELLYHVKQRATFRYGELYNLAFNPSNLREDGKDIRKALKSAWVELTRLFSYDLSHEVLATTLRVEHFLNNATKKKLEQLNKVLCEALPDFHGDAYRPLEYETPSVDEAVEDSPLDEKWLFSFFKNGKFFFEGDGKQKLRVELEGKINDLIQRFLQRHQLLLQSTYLEQAKQKFNALLESIEYSISEHVEGYREALLMRMDQDQLQLRLKQLKLLLPSK